MVSIPTWFRYVAQKLEYSVTLSYQNYKHGEITNRELVNAIWKIMFQEKLTFKLPTPEEGEIKLTALIRKIPDANPWLPFRRHVAVGDVVLYMLPECEDNEHRVGTLTATGGDEIVSTDEKDEPFVLNKHQCWIIGGDDAKDSRTYGPICTCHIAGRVIYMLENAVVHGAVANSHVSMKKDLPVLEVELDVEEMAKIHPSNSK